MRILVVDDEPVVRELAVEILRRSGYLPEGADGAQAALQRLEEEPFDCLLTDVVMPGMTGLELLQELRERRHELPVVLMTGGSQEPERTSNAVRLGAAGLLYKPFSHDELNTAVERALGR